MSTTRARQFELSPNLNLCVPLFIRGTTALLSDFSIQHLEFGIFCLCQPNRANNSKMPKMPKSVQSSLEPAAPKESGWGRDYESQKSLRLCASALCVFSKGLWGCGLPLVAGDKLQKSSGFLDTFAGHLYALIVKTRAVAPEFTFRDFYCRDPAHGT
jgi:hypothetical protein